MRNYEKRLRYWFEMYTQEIFIPNSHPFMTFINNDVATKILYKLCDFVLLSSECTDDEIKKIKSKCYKKLINILHIMVDIPLTEAERKEQIEYVKKKYSDIHEATEIMPKYLRFSKHIKPGKNWDMPGVKKEFEITIFLFSFIVVEIYYHHLFKNCNFEIGERFDSHDDILILDCSYSLVKNGYIEDSKFKKLPVQLVTLDNYFEHLGMIMDLWRSLTIDVLQFIKGFEEYFKSNNAIDILNFNEQGVDDLSNLLKNHFCMFFVYPLYFEAEAKKQIEEAKELYKFELKKICQRNFQLLQDGKNMQKLKITRNSLKNNIENIKEDMIRDATFFHFENITDNLSNVIVDYDLYLKYKKQSN